MELSDKELIERYKEGYKESLETLFSRYLSSTYTFLIRITQNQAVAEDATSEAFFKAWKHLRKFNSDQPFKPWLFKIARNTAYDILRKKKLYVFSDFDTEEGGNSVTDSLTDPLPLPPELLEQNMLHKDLEQALLTLSPTEREALHLYYNEEMTFNEIGVLLEKPLHTVKSQVRRALEKLRKTLITMHH